MLRGHLVDVRNHVADLSVSTRSSAGRDALAAYDAAVNAIYRAADEASRIGRGQAIRAEAEKLPGSPKIPPHPRVRPTAATFDGDLF